MAQRDRGLVEWVVLALLAEGAVHGFALARELGPDGDLGRIVTVAKPQVYRAIDRLVEDALAEPHHTEPGDAGPTRTLHRATPEGLRLLTVWRLTPVEHVRDLRIEFLAKLRLTERAGLDPSRLIAAQRRELAVPLQRLSAAGPAPGADVVERWRRHNAVAASNFLAELSDIQRENARY